MLAGRLLSNRKSFGGRVRIAVLIKQLTLLVSYVKNNVFSEVVDTKRCSFVGQAGMFLHRTHVESVILMVRK
ncbi:hypothetical protein PAENIP36_61760 [Paenibacillus sp. P36]